MGFAAFCFAVATVCATAAGTFGQDVFYVPTVIGFVAGSVISAIELVDKIAKGERNRR